MSKERLNMFCHSSHWCAADEKILSLFPGAYSGFRLIDGAARTSSYLLPIGKASAHHFLYILFQ